MNYRVASLLKIGSVDAQWPVKSFKEIAIISDNSRINWIKVVRFWFAEKDLANRLLLNSEASHSSWDGVRLYYFH